MLDIWEVNFCGVLRLDLEPDPAGVLPLTFEFCKSRSCRSIVAREIEKSALGDFAFVLLGFETAPLTLVRELILGGVFVGVGV